VQAFDSNFTCARCVFTQDSKSYSTAEYQAAIEIVSSLLPTRALDSLAITDSSFYPGFDKGRGFRDVIIAATNISRVLIDSSTFHLHRYVGMYQRCIASHRIASHRIASHRIASHRIASHRIASHRIASHCIASHCHGHQVTDPLYNQARLQCH
jgi:hypothetical protein